MLRHTFRLAGLAAITLYNRADLQSMMVYHGDNEDCEVCMEKTEFIDLIMSTTWVEGGSTFSGADCWGVVVLYYRHVHGIELENDHHEAHIGSIETGIAEQISTGDWVEIFSPDEDGVVFMAYVGDSPRHCGVIYDGRVLHSSGGRDRNKAFCRIDRKSSINRMYRDMRFFIHRELIK